MADPRGFMKSPRAVAARRPVEERVHDWHEVYPESPGRAVLPIIQTQAGRCMDCGIPFCHTGCPLGNLIPEWNDLIWRDDWRGALDRLHATNNFPEFTGRLCPAPCETACVVGISRDPVTIKNVEVAIIDKAWDDRRVVPEQPAWHTLKTVAVVGSGPAGLAVAQQLTRVGHTIVVYERADDIGGLLRFGIPEFKMEKDVLDRRLKQMRLEGTVFKPGVDVGTDVTFADLRQRFDVVVLAIGSTVGRDLPVPGRELGGIHQAMEFLPQANRVARGIAVADQIVATDKDVVIIGGGDTGADCLGTSIRQGARTVTQLEIMPTPPGDRPAGQPWPTYPIERRTSRCSRQRCTSRFGRTRWSTGSPRPTRRAASGCTRSTPRSSWVTTTATCGPCGWSRSGWRTAGSSPWRVRSVRSRLSWCCSRWASRARSARRSSSSGSISIRAATSRGAPITRPTCQACSSAATPGAGSR